MAEKSTLLSEPAKHQTPLAVGKRSTSGSCSDGPESPPDSSTVSREQNRVQMQQMAESIVIALPAGDRFFVEIEKHQW